MTERMLRFVKIGRVPPQERPAQDRAHDFHEIYREFAAGKAAEQAARCSQCGVPFCQVHCPLQNNIPDWLKATAEGRLEEAYELSAATNNMPEVCGRICPQDRLCEGNCVIEQAGHGTVTIGAVERFLTDTAWQKGWVKPLMARRERTQSIGIIGAGPAGLAASEELRKLGYRIDIYDRYDRAGGLLTYGIPNFKLEKNIVERRIRRLADGGVKFNFNFDVGKSASLDALRARHDAILIATGVYKARGLEVPGAGAACVYPAMTYLSASNRKGLGDVVPAFDCGDLDARGKDIVVIGGGDTAMDCVRTAVRQGAKSVKCLYRRDHANMPGSMREVKNAIEEGVEFMWLSSPKALLTFGDAPGQVRAVRAIKMRLGLPDSSGRQTPEDVPGSEFNLAADMVIEALGFDPEDLPGAFGAHDLALTRRGTLKTDFRTLMTNLDGVFAAGDIVRGASLVVWAIRDGRDAAASIHNHLEARAADGATARLRSVAAAE
jgi:glutamate synthase (NADPH) small chain